jgi:hypothetical protein
MLASDGSIMERVEAVAGTSPPPSHAEKPPTVEPKAKAKPRDRRAAAPHPRQRGRRHPARVSQLHSPVMSGQQPEPEGTPNTKKQPTANAFRRVGVAPTSSGAKKRWATERTRLLEELPVLMVIDGVGDKLDSLGITGDRDDVLGFSKALVSDEFRPLSILAIQMVRPHDFLSRLAVRLTHSLTHHIN